MSFYKRLMVVVFATLILLGITFIFSYDIIKFDFVTFMEIQPSFDNMEKPLPVAARSVPIEGAAYIPGQGVPDNPIESDAFSIERGRLLFSVHCAQCHGLEADGAGALAGALVYVPRDLTDQAVQDLPDGSIFLTISQGIIADNVIRMPALNENLSVRDRWDVVNYIKSLESKGAQ